MHGLGVNYQQLLRKETVFSYREVEGLDTVMRITEKVLETKERQFVSYCEEFAQLVDLVSVTAGLRLLCVNPRDGSMVTGFIKNGSLIDRFVSDDEWINTAQSFSDRVYAGYSHHPLLEVEDESYDMVVVCEDFALVDDCDAMTVQYHRVLKRGGALVCGVWNMSFSGYLEALLFEKSLPEDFKSLLHGTHSLMLDALVIRLERLGFTKLNKTAYCPAGMDSMNNKYARVSEVMENPADEEYFGTKIFFIEAIK